MPVSTRVRVRRARGAAAYLLQKYKTRTEQRDSQAEAVFAMLQAKMGGYRRMRMLEDGCKGRQGARLACMKK